MKNHMKSDSYVPKKHFNSAFYSSKILNQARTRQKLVLVWNVSMCVFVYVSAIKTIKLFM